VDPVYCRRRRKVLQGGHAATLQRTLGKRDCSQNDKLDRGGISLCIAEFRSLNGTPAVSELCVQVGRGDGMAHGRLPDTGEGLSCLHAGCCTLCVASCASQGGTTRVLQHFWVPEFGLIWTRHDQDEGRKGGLRVCAEHACD
jgi:hypothetical protein